MLEGIQVNVLIRQSAVGRRIVRILHEFDLEFVRREVLIHRIPLGVVFTHDTDLDDLHVALSLVTAPGEAQRERRSHRKKKRRLFKLDRHDEIPLRKIKKPENLLPDCRPIAIRRQPEKRCGRTALEGRFNKQQPAVRRFT